MRFLYPIAALIACVLFFMFLPLFANYCDNIDMDFQQYKLDKSLELSVRAAAFNGLDHGLVSFDRSELKEVEFNTGVVLDTYAQFMAFNYDMIPTDYNKELMLNRTVLMTIGARGFSITQNEYGEYYVAGNGTLGRSKGAFYRPDGTVDRTQVSANTGSRTFMGVYTPFIIKGTDEGGRDVYVSGSLLSNASAFMMVTPNAGAGGKPLVQVVTSLPGDITPSRVQHEALAQMTRAFTQAWYQLNNKNSENGRLTFPNSITNLGVSSVADPGVLALVDGFNLETTRPLRSCAFTGYKVVARREIVAYTETSPSGAVSHWYAYRDQIDVDKALAGQFPGIQIDYIYPDMHTAATVEIKNCTHHKHDEKCTCLDANGKPSLPHCHYQPNLEVIMR